MKRIIVAVILFLLHHICHGVNFNRIEALKRIDDCTISHIYQTRDNAIWIASTDGLLRFDGKKARPISFDCPGWVLELEYGEGKYIWQISTDAIQRANMISLQTEKMAEHDVNFRGCITMARGDSLFVSNNEALYCCNDNGLYLYGSMPEGELISSMLDTKDGSFLISTKCGKIYKDDGRGSRQQIHNCKKPIRKLFADSKGRLWAGLLQGGVIMIENGKSQEFPVPVKDARTMCEDQHGNILVGSSGCLFTILTDGKIKMENPGTPGAHSITNIFKDADGNIWIGTFYNGIFYSNSERCPFSRPSIDGLDKVKLVNDIVQDSRGDLWIATDQYGLFRMSNGRLQEIPDTREYKIKALAYDADEDCLWVGRDRTSLLRYNLKRKSWKEIQFFHDGVAIPMAGTNAIKRHAGEFLIGSSQGLWKFNPKKEEFISRRFKGYNQIVHDIEIDTEGRIWIGGNGLYTNSGDSLAHAHEVISIIDTSITADRAFTGLSAIEDEIWAASNGRGIIVINKKGLQNYTTSNSGIANNRCLTIECLNDGNVLTGTTHGISITNRASRFTLNYNENNGLKIGSMREGCIFKINETTYLIGGTEGLALYETSKTNFEIKDKQIKLEKISSNDDTPYVYNGEDRIIFRHNQKNFSFYLAAHDYENIIKQIYEYKLEGFDSDWRRFDIADPIRFMNMEHGKYRLAVRRRIPGEAGSVREDISLDIILKPAWYEAGITQILGVIIILAIIGVILFSTYSKLLLRQELKYKEEENNERTRFFIRVSHQLRTPLSLVIGQLELFLKKNEKSISGIKHLEYTYKHALEIKRIIGGFVEMENKVLTPNIDDLPPEEELEALLQNDRSIVPGPITESGTMLIADDNAGMRSMLRDIFSEEYKILEAINGADALELAQNMQPDIIISDVMMPVMDGLTLCARLRSNFTTSHIPIILLTAHVSEKHNVEGLGIGADDYIAKPFSVDILRARCKNLLQNRKMLQERYNMTKSDGSEEQPHISKRDTLFINAVIGAIERHLHSGDLSAGTLAEELSVSTSTLNNRISAICNMSTRVFIEDIKLRHAIKMIKDGHNVSETADLLGFSSPKYFTIRFKKKYGKSPSNFK